MDCVGKFSTAVIYNKLVNSFFHQKPRSNVFSTIKGLQAERLDDKEETAETQWMSASQKVKKKKALQWTREQVISLIHLQHAACDD